MSRRWLRTADPRRQDVWATVNNMVPTSRGTYKTPATYTATAASPTAPGTALNAWVTQVVSGAAVAYVGTTTKLWSFTTAPVFTDRSIAGGYTSTATDWGFAQFGNYTLATNGVEQIQVRDATGVGAFANLGGSPPATAKIIVVQSNAVLAFNLDSGGHNWAASDVGNHANWTTGDAVADTPILARPGPITAAIAFGNDVIVFKESSIYRMRYVGSPVYWTVDLIADGIGALYPEQAVVCGDALFFCGPSGAFLYDGATFRRVDRETGFSDGTPELGNLFVNSRAMMYWPSTASVWLHHDEGDIYVYNAESDRWGSFTARKTTVGTELVAHVLLTGTVAAQRAFGGTGAGTDTKAFFVDPADTTNTLMTGGGEWDGVTDASIGTGFMGLGPNTDTIFSRVTPLLVGDITATSHGQPSAAQMSCALAAYATPIVEGATTPAASPVTSATNSKRFDFLYTARYMTFSISCTASNWEIDDVEVEMKRGGET